MTRSWISSCLHPLEEIIRWQYPGSRHVCILWKRWLDVNILKKIFWFIRRSSEKEHVRAHWFRGLVWNQTKIVPHPCVVFPSSSVANFLSPPNEVSEGTMKRAPYVCVSVRLCVRVSVRPGSKINEKCYFSVISWPILILFVLSDRAWCGLQNFYTEFWNSLIMQIYANLFKINEKCYFSVISWPILILFVLSDRAWCGLQNFYTELWNSVIMQIYANLFKIIEKCYFSVISWPILILFVLSDRAWCGLQNFYTEFWNSLIMQIYSKSMKNATSLFLGRFWFC